MKAIEIPQSLKTVLRRLRLSPMLATLPDRVAYARSKKLTELQLLELVLQDEIDRRDNKQLTNRISRAGFDEEHTLEGFDWDAPVTFDHNQVRDLFNLGFVERAEDGGVDPVFAVAVASEETRFRNEEDLAIIRILRPTIAPEIDSGIEEKAVAVRAIRKWVVNGNSLIGLVGAGNAEEDYLLLKGPRPTFGFFLQIRRDAAGWYVDNLGMFR